MKVKLINIQGLTKEKGVEVEELLLKENDYEINILCLVETHQKYKKVDFSDDVINVDKMRKLEDKKGGGLTVLMNRNSFCELNEQECKNSDILLVNAIIKNVTIKLILVYVDVKDKLRYEILMRQLDSELDKIKDGEKVILLGDFNGHIGFLGPQTLNHNGEKLLNLAEKWNLIILNGDSNCKGEITRRQGEIESTIDFILVNQAMYMFFETMTVDESKEKFDLSDHCLLEANFKMEMICKRGNKQRIVERDFYKTDCDILRAEFMKKTKEDIELSRSKGETLEMENLEDVLKNNAERILKKTYKTRMRVSDNKEEPVWMNGEIRSAIKRRRDYNRKRRNARNNEEKNHYETLYKEEREKARQLKKSARVAHEKRITQEIRETKGSGKKMWQMISKLKGQKQKMDKEPEVFDEEGRKLESSLVQDRLIEFWKTIYNGHPNDMAQEWNGDIREEYAKEMEDKNRGTLILYTSSNHNVGNMEVQTQCLVGHLKEHMDSAGKIISEAEEAMEWKNWEAEEVKAMLRKIKRGKQPGPDKIKGEFLKWLAEDPLCTETLTSCLNKVVQDNKIPERWRNSKTVMLQKNNKPKVKDFRPIAFMNSGYKLLMSLIKEKVIEHVATRGELSMVQAGFTPGRRLEDNIFILNYCIANSKERKRELVIAAIDYQKAFDSVDRRALIKALKTYECHPLLIDIISSIYTNDKTNLPRRRQSWRNSCDKRH